jgi:hypothetical protein
MSKHHIVVKLDQGEYESFAAAAHAKGESLEQFLRTAGRARSTWVGLFSTSPTSKVAGSRNKEGQTVDKNGK